MIMQKERRNRKIQQNQGENSNESIPESDLFETEIFLKSSAASAVMSTRCLLLTIISSEYFTSDSIASTVS